MKNYAKAGLALSVLCMALLVVIPAALAQEEGTSAAPIQTEMPVRIDETMVLDLLNKLSAFYTFDKPDLPPLMTFIEARIDPSARFETEMHVNELVQPQIKRYNRSQILADIRENFVKAYNSKAKYKLENITISEDGLQVAVKYHVWLSSAYASIEPKTRRNAEINVKSLSVCDDDFRLIEGMLKIVGSKCVQDVSIAKPIFLE